MKENVYFIKIKNDETDEVMAQKLEKLLRERDLLSFIEARDMVPIKTHFGEVNTKGFVRPIHIKVLGELIKEKKGLPFMTETSTLYRGKRTNAVEHIQHAHDHGFTLEYTGMPIIMADGLLGDEEHEVEIPGKHYKKVNIAGLFARTQAAIMVSHFTGHMLTGFGAALKNMGMGCASRKGKLIQHSTAKPSIKLKACTGCEECFKWCPHDAITMNDGKAQIKNKKCVGCGECLAVCRFDAVGYNWGETYKNIQEKVVEHAMGVAKTTGKKTLYINFLNRITKDCDCMHDNYEKIIDDVGILVSMDPVALDAASLDLAEKQANQKLSNLAFDIPYKLQIEYAKELGFGNADYELIEA